MRQAITDRARLVVPSTVVPGCTPIAAYRGAVDDLHALAAAVDQTPAVLDVMAHVAGVEQLVLRWLVGKPVDLGEHGAVRASLDLHDWHRLTLEVEQAARAADAGRALPAYGLVLDVDGLLVLRTFELWTHTHDVARAAGVPTPDTAPPRLALMSARLSEVLPMAMAVRGVSRPGRTARLVLTGVAPGCFDVSLDPADAPGQPDVTIVVDVVEVCRLAARRAVADGIGVVFEGDEALGRLVLAAADAFAQD